MTPHQTILSHVKKTVMGTDLTSFRNEVEISVLHNMSSTYLLSIINGRYSVISCITWLRYVTWLTLVCKSNKILSTRKRYCLLHRDDCLLTAGTEKSVRPGKNSGNSSVIKTFYEFTKVYCGQKFLTR